MAKAIKQRLAICPLFGETPAESCFIETIRKHGYRLLIPARPVAGQSRVVGLSARPSWRRTQRYRASWLAALAALALVVYGLGRYSSARQPRSTFVHAEPARPGNTFVFSIRWRRSAVCINSLTGSPSPNPLFRSEREP